MFKRFGSPGAMALPAGILMLIVLMIVPLPSVLLDVFFVVNIALSVAILMAAMNAEKPASCWCAATRARLPPAT